MRHLRQPRMRTGAVHHDEIRPRRHVGDRGPQPGVKGILPGLQRFGRDLGQVAVIRRGQRQPRPRHIGPAVFHIAAKAFLPQVQVQRTHAEPQPRQRGADMHAGG